MDLFHSLAGMIEAELTSADLGDSLMAISAVGIELLDVSQKSDLTARIRISRSAYPKVRQLCEKRGDTLRPVSRDGIYWKLKMAVRRPVLIAGLMFLFVLALVLPTRVLFVEVEGNGRISSRRILEAAEACGIGFGASRREIRSEKVKNALLQELPELQWAGINTRGCVAVISVRERSVSEEVTANSGFGNVVALREGIITACTATRGTLLCQPGQAVVPGQILISGYTDCGIKLLAAGAEGEVFGKTVRYLHVIMPSAYERKLDAVKEVRSYSLIIGKKRIKLWKDSGIWDGTCGRIYEENYITLPGGFQLPVGWGVDTWIYGKTQAETYPEDQAAAQLESAGDAYIRRQMVAGRVEDRNLSVSSDTGTYLLAGKYVCTELIGKWQAEKIGETNGKSD